MSSRPQPGPLAGRSESGGAACCSSRTSRAAAACSSPPEHPGAARSHDRVPPAASATGRTRGSKFRTQPPLAAAPAAAAAAAAAAPGDEGLGSPRGIAWHGRSARGGGATSSRPAAGSPPAPPPSPPEPRHNTPVRRIVAASPSRGPSIADLSNAPRLERQALAFASSLEGVALSPCQQPTQRGLRANISPCTAGKDQRSTVASGGGRRPGRGRGGGSVAPTRNAATAGPLRPAPLYPTAAAATGASPTPRPRQSTDRPPGDGRPPRGASPTPHPQQSAKAVPRAHFRRAGVSVLGRGAAGPRRPASNAKCAPVRLKTGRDPLRL